MNVNTMIGATARSSPPAGRKRRVIAERTYNGYQPSRFIRICRYMILEGIPFQSAEGGQIEEGTNSLLLELENRLEVKVSALRVKITQLDAEGQEIGETQHTFGGLRATPGAVFVPAEAIFLRPACASVLVQVMYADAAPYRYRVYGDRPEVGLIEEEIEPVTNGRDFRASDRPVMVKDKVPHGYRLMTLAVVGVVLILLALTVYSVLYGFIGKAVDDFLLNDLWRPIKRFFTDRIPGLFRKIFSGNESSGFGEFFTEKIPSGLQKFFTEILPNFFRKIFSWVF